MIRVRDAVDAFRQSLFFLPALFVIGGFGLAWILSAVEIPTLVDVFPALFRTKQHSGRDVLTTVATGTMAAVAIVFGAMLVALQLSASRFSPRVIRDFIGDRRIQVVMGAEIGTVTYALMALQLAGTSSPEESVPSLAVLGAVILGVLALLALLAAVDHLARSLQVGAIARRVTEQTLNLIRDLSADEDQPDGFVFQAPTMVPTPGGERSGGTPLLAWREGWIQQISREGIQDALPVGYRIVLDVGIGSYVVGGSPIGWIQPGLDDQLDNQFRHDILEGIDIGPERTMQQDIGYGLVRLEDIGLLALSPAINDLNTGVEAIVRLGSVLTALLECQPGPIDDNATVRPSQVPVFNDFLRSAFDEIRISAASHPTVLEALVRTLARIKDEAVRQGHQAAVPPLEEQGRLILAGLESGEIFLQADRDRVIETARTALFQDQADSLPQEVDV